MSLPTADNQRSNPYQDVSPPPRFDPSRSSQGDFQSLFEVAAARLGMGRQFRAIKICHDAGLILQRLLPEHSGQYRITSFKDGVLTITSGNSSLSQKIQMQAHLLQSELNTAAGTPVIDRVKLKNA